jgi:hypothetical protein
MRAIKVPAKCLQNNQTAELGNQFGEYRNPLSKGRRSIHPTSDLQQPTKSNRGISDNSFQGLRCLCSENKSKIGKRAKNFLLNPRPV